MVEMRLDWIDTKFPPMPLIIGWNTTKELYKSTTLSSTRPPSLQDNKPGMCLNIEWFSE